MTRMSRKLFIDSVRRGIPLDAAMDIAEGYGEVGMGVPLDRRLFCARVQDCAKQGLSARDALRMTFQGSRDELFEAGKDGKIQADTVDAHESFEHVERSVAAKGAHDPAALAAWIGRKNLGKKKFQARAEAGRA